MSSSRQLAAIMFADIAGYTALMQEDEERALQLREKFETVLHQEITSHAGRILKMMGDGALCLFTSSIEAVNAALAVQLEMLRETVVPLRIGIHMGDVVVDEADVYGDSVNIASRVESFAVPGSIFISAKIFDDIKNHKDIRTVLMGTFWLKNVKEPVAIYAISNQGLVVPQKAKLEGKGKISEYSTKKWLRWLMVLVVVGLFAFFAVKQMGSRASATANTTKAIAILPFRNESPVKDENEYFCNGMMESVLNNLSQINSFRVISRQSVEQYRGSKKTAGIIADELGVSYILEGSVQRQGNQVKIIAQLIDAKADEQIWSSTFTSELDDVFALQENIAEEIAGALKVKIAPDVASRLGRIPSTNQKALDLYYEAQTLYAKQTFLFPNQDAAYHKIQALCSHALALDSLFADAQVLKAKAYWDKQYYNAFRIKMKETELLDSVAHPCEKALALDNNSVNAMVLLSDYNFHLGNEERGFNYLQKAVAINPSHVEANLRLAGYYAASDTTSDKQLHYLLDALRLNPQSAATANIYYSLAVAYLTICDFDKAKDYAEKAIRQNENIKAKADGLNLMAIIFSRIGSGDDVIRYTDQARKYDEFHADYYGAEGYCYLKNDCEKAVQLYDQIWKKYPDQVNPHRYAVALWKIGKKEQALAYAKQALGKVAPYDEAGVNSLLGNKKAAYKILHQPSYNPGVWAYGLPYFILRDPLFENLWHDKEFQDLVANVQAEKAKLRERIRHLEQKGEL